MQQFLNVLPGSLLYLDCGDRGLAPAARENRQVSEGEGTGQTTGFGAAPRFNIIFK